MNFKLKLKINKNLNIEQINLSRKAYAKNMKWVMKKNSCGGECVGGGHHETELVKTSKFDRKWNNCRCSIQLLCVRSTFIEFKWAFNILNYTRKYVT